MASKNVAAWMPESSCFKTLFCSQSVHGTQTLLKCVWQSVHTNFPLIYEKLSQKTSGFVPCKMLGLFGNTLAADHMDSRHTWGKFPQQVKIPLSQKEKKLFRIFIAFLQSTQNFAHSEKKCQLYSLNSWEVIGSKKCGCLNTWKLLLQNAIPHSNCSQESNTAEICLVGRLS